MKKIILKNIVKEYHKGTIAVDNFCISAENGDFVVLVGPSGCGKSTILRMIAGLEEITSGEIFFDDLKVNNLEPQERNVGMVFQNYALYPHLNVFDNLSFPLTIKKVSKNVINSRVKEIAELVGLGDYLHRKPKELSGGQRQRVALGRALIRKPDIFLFDEPLSNLDAKLRVQMRNDIIHLHKTAQTTSVYVTHDQTEAMTMGTKIAVIDKGKLQQFGTPDQVYNHPENIFVAGFLGSPQMNFIDGIINDSKFKFDNYEISIELTTNYQGKATLGIRPENFIIDKNSYDFIVKIERIEYLGYEQIYYCSLGNLQLCLRDSSNSVNKCDDQLSLKFNKSNLHFFDSMGNRIK